MIVTTISQTRAYVYLFGRKVFGGAAFKCVAISCMEGIGFFVHVWKALASIIACCVFTLAVPRSLKPTQDEENGGDIQEMAELRKSMQLAAIKSCSGGRCYPDLENR